MGCNRKLKLLVSQLFRGLEERFKISFAADSASDHGSVNCLYLHFLPTAVANAGICFKSVCLCQQTTKWFSRHVL